MSNKPARSSAHLSWIDDAGRTQTLVFDLVESETWDGGATVSQHPVELGPNVSDHIHVENRTCALKVFCTNEPIESNQWTDVSLEDSTIDLPSYSFSPFHGVALPSYPVTPFDGVVDVVDWDSKLGLRILAATAGGAVGDLAGGPVGGVVGGLVAGAVAGALLEDKVVHKSVQTNAGSRPPAAPPPLAVRTLAVATAGDYVAQTIALLKDLRERRQTIDVFGTKDSCIGPSGFGGMAIVGFTHAREVGTGTGASLMLTFQELRLVSTTTVPAPKATEPRAKAPVKKGNQEGLDSDLKNEFSAGYRNGKADAIGEANGGGS